MLFGPETFGLANEALDRCHAILRIPTVPHDASLNLAQAALLVAYELFLAATAAAIKPADPFPESAAMQFAALETADPLATGVESEAMFAALLRMLEALHAPPIPGRTNVLMARLRALFLRAAPRADEAAVLTQLFEHLARRVRGAPDAAP